MRHPIPLLTTALLLLASGCTPDGILWVPGGGGPDDAPHEHVDGAEEPAEQPEETVEGVGDLNAWMFDGSTLPTFELTIAPAQMEALHQSYLDWIYYGVPFHEYVEASFEYDGELHDPVGVRLKGQGSALDVWDKPALKVKFNAFMPGARFRELESLTLNNMSVDYSMMHERLAYHVYREAGVAASRCQHALVEINGEPYGLYSNVESTDPLMIARWFDDPDGTLFEGWDVDFTPEYVQSFQLEYGPDDRSALAGLAAALQQPGQAGLDAAAEFVDLQQFRQYWAVGAVVGQFDAYPYTWPGDDFHVYHDPTSDQLHFIPWGVDETFYYPDNSVEAINGLLAQRCQQVASCREAWIDQVWEVMDLVEAMDWETEAAAIRAEIAPLVEADDHKPYATGDVLYYQDVMAAMIANRRAQLTYQLGAP